MRRCRHRRPKIARCSRPSAGAAACTGPSRSRDPVASDQRDRATTPAPLPARAIALRTVAAVAATAHDRGGNVNAADRRPRRRCPPVLIHDAVVADAAGAPLPRTSEAAAAAGRAAVHTLRAVPGDGRRAARRFDPAPLFASELVPGCSRRRPVDQDLAGATITTGAPPISRSVVRSGRAGRGPRRCAGPRASRWW